MTQSKKGSLLETVVSTSIGYVVAVVSQIIILPMFGLTPSFSENLGIASAFTVVSLVRGYFVRRTFNWFINQKEAQSRLTFSVKRLD